MLELNCLAPIKSRNPQGLFAAIKLNKVFANLCHDIFVIVGFGNNSEDLADHQMIGTSARDPPRRTD